MTTPAKPRQSGIPGLGRSTPARSRSTSNVHQANQTPADDISRALVDALKANDPSQHWGVPITSNASASSLSPQSGAYSMSSDRRSVVGRPSSVASSSSAKIQERTRTPTSARTSSRPPSRQSELNKPVRTFEAGDNVRIESLGFEGTLRYMGEIDGKPGLWAGIELSGGFSGKGKNNGSVGGKQYFLCPDKCGVFVATTKLSAPTVGPGAIQRPSSVASSRGGKITPAPTIGMSGRTTPSFFSTSRTPSASFSNGRITPASGGRVTPSMSSGRITPSSALVQRPFKTPTSKTTTKTTAISLSDKITAGSRASKYMTMTAQQLSSRDQDAGKDSPTRKSGERFGSAMGSPTISRTLSSPTRPTGSPFTTPKAGYARPSNAGASPTLPSTRSRTSMNTPRARIPSGLAMPPPPSPKALNSHQTPSTTEDTHSAPLSRLESQDNLLLEKSALTASSMTFSRPTSSTSDRSIGTDELSTLEQLQSRLDAAEYENERLRAAAEAEAGVASSGLAEKLQMERQEALDKCLDLEGKLSVLENSLTSQTSQLEVLQAENQKLHLNLNEATSQMHQAIADHQSNSEKDALEIRSLQEKLEDLDHTNRQKDEINAGHTLTIEQLSTSLEKSYIDSQEEKRELGIQIDELRVAGQETIALYEERLSAANTTRYELEHQISTLQTSINSVTTNKLSQESASHITSSATQIDNETLRDQVQHLQKKSAKLEEQLEDARATLERDVGSYQDKISRIRVEDEQRKRDLAFKTREVEQLLKSETSARNRIEEIEEALRESTVALENARGEVEALRAEFANLEVLIDDATEVDISSKLANFTKRVSAARSQHQQEISRLEKSLLDSRVENDRLLQRISTDATDSSKSSTNLQETLDVLNAENKTLRKQINELEARLSVTAQSLEDRTSEVDSVRKKSNRDLSISNGALESFKTLSVKPEPSTEEVAGLKHIVQELQKENLASAQQIKLLQSENAILSTEAEQLRQEVHVLEENLDKSFDEKSEVGIIPSPRSPSEQRIPAETDLDQMRKRLSEAEIKHARMVHGLNKEISELEALVESKIYREDELEQELERLKEKLSRQKKTSKNGNDIDGRQRLSSASSTASSVSLGRSEEVCEICERPGHDIFNCSLLKDDTSKSMKEVVVCEDCESPGHVAAECPHSLDVF